MQIAITPTAYASVQTESQSLGFPLDFTGSGNRNPNGENASRRRCWLWIGRFDSTMFC